MPRVTINVNGSYESIVRPVALGILKDVMAATGMSDHNVESTLLGEFGVREQAGSKMGEAGSVEFGATSKATVTLEDNVKYDSILSTKVRDREYPPILADQRLGIGVFPVYVDSELTLTFRYTAANKEEALKWRDDYMIKRAEDRTTLYHEIFYYIPIQDGIVGLLKHFHDLREKVSGYGDTFLEYFNSMKMRELTTLTGVDGQTSKGTIAVPEKQIQVTGMFDFNEPPKEEKDDGGTRWNIDFTYKCFYKRCTHLYIVYPMAIHQSHISRKYFQETTYFSYEELDKISGVTVYSNDKIKRISSPSRNPLETYGLSFPQWDDWIPKANVDPIDRYVKPVFTWMLGINPKNPTRLFDLTTMPEFRLSMEVDRFMRRHHQKMTKRRKSIIYLRLYKDDLPSHDSLISLNEDLLLEHTSQIDLRNLYHVRFNIILSTKFLDKEAIDDMREDPEFTYVILKTLNPNLDDKKFLSSIVSDKIIHRGYIEDELSKIETALVPGSIADKNTGYYKDGVTQDSVKVDNSGSGHWEYRPSGPTWVPDKSTISNKVFNDLLKKDSNTTPSRITNINGHMTYGNGPWSGGGSTKTVQNILIVAKR